jgi:hypothetical protein
MSMVGALPSHMVLGRSSEGLTARNLDLYALSVAAEPAPSASPRLIRVGAAGRAIVLTIAVISESISAGVRRGLAGPAGGVAQPLDDGPVQVEVEADHVLLVLVPGSWADDH